MLLHLKKKLFFIEKLFNYVQPMLLAYLIFYFILFKTYYPSVFAICPLMHC